MKLRGDERRNKILETLQNAKSPISGTQLAELFAVSRQVIVTDIALLRTSHPELLATNSGYVIMGISNTRRVFKVKHTDEQTEDELTCITDLGGTVVNVYVEHKVYGTISAPLNISSKRDVMNFIKDLKSGVSSPLKNITHGYHYHTVEARSEGILDEIEEALKEKGYLIEALQNTPVYEAKNYSKI
ncbi:MAG: transcription repressor NadR [Treponema sp.]|nr:transcription repressor NadR [Treponema sp.]